MTRIAFVDHSYHSKTESTQFLANLLLERGHAVDFFWDESWRGGTAVSWQAVRDHEAVIMFQSACRIGKWRYYRKLHPNVSFIPMLDCLEVAHGPRKNGHTMWRQWQGSKILSFSQHTHGMAVGFGLRSLHVRYYLPFPESIVPKQGLHGFFWLRRQEHVSWPMVKALIGDTRFESLHVHVAEDPDTAKVELPDEQECRLKNITISRWFAQKEEYFQTVRKANVFFAPRLEEGIGMSFLEAMGMGQCVVAPDAGTMNEYIVHGVNGLLYHPKVVKPLDFSKVASLGANAREGVRLGRLAWEANGDKIVDFLLTPSAKAYAGYYDYFGPRRHSLKWRWENLKKHLYGKK